MDAPLSTTPTANELSSAHTAASEGDLSEIDIKQIKRRSIAGTISYLLQDAVSQGLTVAGQLILSAYLSPSDFGVYGIAIQIIGLLVFFSDIGLAAALVQKQEEPSVTDYRTAFTVQQILAWSIVGVVLILIATGIVGAKVGTAGTWLLFSLALSFPITGFKTISSIRLERKLQYSKLVIPQIAENLIFTSIVVALAIKGAGVSAYTYAVLARAIGGLIVMWYIEPWPIGLALARSSLKTLLHFGAKFQLNDFIARVKDQMFYLAMGIFLPTTQFGYVQWSKNLSVMPYSLTVQNVTAIMFPTFSRIQSHPNLLKRAIEKSLFFSSILVFPMLTGMCLFIWPITQVITKYQKWEPAVLSFIFFSLSVTGSALVNPITNMLNAIGKINITLKFMTVWTILTWVITPIFVWKFGFNGIAIAAFPISLITLWPIFYLKKVVAFDFWPQVIPAGGATILMAIVGILGMKIWSQSLLHLLGGMLLVGAVYGVALLAIGQKRLITEILSLKN